MTLTTTIVVPAGTDAPDLGREVLEAPPGTPLVTMVPAATGDVTVLLEDGATLTPEGLRELLALFDEQWVAAVGPVFNAGGVTQRVDIGVSWDAPDALVDAASTEWSELHAGGHHGALRLEPWCVAFRTAAAATVGSGAGTVDELCRRIVTAGYHCAVAEAVYVHRRTDPAPAPSVEDEVRHLARV